MFVLITLPKIRVLGAKDKDEAVKLGEKNNGLPVTSSASLAQVPMALLVKIYNMANPKKRIERFSDRNVAVERVWRSLESIQERAPRAARAPGAPKGDTSAQHWGKYAEKTITALVTENPRREGTHGHKSFAIILKAGAKGISYEDFLKAGGRRQDLAWDEARKAVKLTKEPTA